MKINTVFVIGAGAMGTGIAQISAQAGQNVILYDISSQQTSAALKHISESLDRRIAKGAMTVDEKKEIQNRITVSDSLSAASEADLVLEAVAEKLEIKKKLFSEISKYAKDDAILASNTSSISITSIATAVNNPERFIGLHFFNPATAMKLLEIIPGLRTSEETLKDAKAWGESLHKIMIVANDTPGFIVNRLLNLMLNEAAILIEEGIAPEDIDKGMKYGLNHPMGPLELADFAGVDILNACMNTYYSEFKDSKYRPALRLERMVESGYIGKKARHGFYEYNDKGERI